MDARSVDLARLIADRGRRGDGGHAGGPSRACACHAVAEDCCPTRLQSVIDAGADAAGLSRHGRRTGRRRQG